MTDTETEVKHRHWDTGIGYLQMSLLIGGLTGALTLIHLYGDSSNTARTVSRVTEGALTMDSLLAMCWLMTASIAVVGIAHLWEGRTTNDA